MGKGPGPGEGGGGGDGGRYRKYFEYVLNFFVPGLCGRKFNSSTPLLTFALLALVLPGNSGPPHLK